MIIRRSSCYKRIGPPTGESTIPTTTTTNRGTADGNGSGLLFVAELNNCIDRINKLRKFSETICQSVANTIESRPMLFTSVISHMHTNVSYQQQHDNLTSQRRRRSTCTRCEPESIARKTTESLIVVSDAKRSMPRQTLSDSHSTSSSRSTMTSHMAKVISTTSQRRLATSQSLLLVLLALTVGASCFLAALGHCAPIDRITSTHTKAANLLADAQQVAEHLQHQVAERVGSPAAAIIVELSDRPTHQKLEEAREDDTVLVLLAADHSAPTSSPSIR